MAIRPPDHSRGLRALEESRATRRRQLIKGTANVRHGGPAIWLWAVVVMAVMAVVNWRYTAYRLREDKAEILSEQATVKRSLGVQIDSLLLTARQLSEELGQEPASSWLDKVEPELKLSSLRTEPGIYLRLPASIIKKDDDAFTAVAMEALHDGFTSCMFQAQKPLKGALEGVECWDSLVCDAGEFCGDMHRCTPPTWPFNLKIALRAKYFLGGEFSSRVQAGKNSLEARAMKRELESAAKHDFPIAEQLFEQSKYLTIVLDEDQGVKLPPAETTEPGMKPESDNSRLQRTTHYARVGVWDRASGRLLLKFRALAKSRMFDGGVHDGLNAKATHAIESNANSCAIATQLSDFLEKER